MSNAQMEVVDHYENSDKARGVATVGRYVRVQSAEDIDKVCMGPLKTCEPVGWRVVEIDWQNKSFLVAPKEDLE